MCGLVSVGYAYLDGDLFVKLSLAMDIIIKDLTEKNKVGREGARPTTTTATSPPTSQPTHRDAPMPCQGRSPAGWCVLVCVLGDAGLPVHPHGRARDRRGGQQGGRGVAPRVVAAQPLPQDLHLPAHPRSTRKKSHQVPPSLPTRPSPH